MSRELYLVMVYPQSLGMSNRMPLAAYTDEELAKEHVKHIEYLNLNGYVTKLPLGGDFDLEEI